MKLHVAVGVVRNSQGEVLIAKRPDNVHLGGLWEFPGGKLESNENTRQALVRELSEELDIQVIEAQPLIKIQQDYSDRQVLLDVWEVLNFHGEAIGKEGQQVAWVAPERLNDYSFPDANRVIINALKLPPFYPILDVDIHSSEQVHTQFQWLVQQKYSLIQLRAKSLSAQQRWGLTETLCQQSLVQGIRLMVNDEPEIAAQLGAAGAHLTAARLMALTARPLGDKFLLSASCHNLVELKQAEFLGLDFVVLSPVLPTQSHPQALPMGWHKFEEMLEKVQLPVYALGGVGRQDLSIAKIRGAQGVSGIRAFLVNAVTNLDK